MFAMLSSVTSACFNARSESASTVSPPTTTARVVLNKVLIPGGEYTVGCEDPSLCPDNPQRRVRLSAFWIDRAQVGWGAYRTCVLAERCPAPFDDGSVHDDPREVAIVPFHGAEAYCQWRQGHLPTDSEWEAAGRGQAAFIYPWGNVWDDKKRATMGFRRFADIGSLYPRSGTRPDLASPFGVWDMSGTAPEFVGGSNAQLRGCPPLFTRERSPRDYSLVGGRAVMPQSFAAFRCAYDQRVPAVDD